MHSSKLMAAGLAAFLPFLAGGCCDDDHDVYVVEDPRPATILVEVYDPTTNYVWENVGVRVVSAWQEWSGVTRINPVVEYFLTDSYGQVFLDEYLLAGADVGFHEDGIGRAMLWPSPYEDEASVRLEVSSPGYTPVLVDVAVSWMQPDVFVAVPFH